MLQHVTDTIFPFEVYIEQSNADSCRQNDIVSDFKTARMCLIGSIILQGGLSAGKPKFL